MQTGLLERLYAMVKAHPHEEICGVVDTQFRIHPVTNVAKDVHSCFVFARQEYFAVVKSLQQTGDKIICVYHSHPNGDVTPSEADKAFTKRSGIPQLIVSTNTYTLVEHA